MVHEAVEVEVTLSTGQTFKARVVGRSLEHDIAVLKVFGPLKDMRPIPIGRSGDLQVGQTVLAIGNPFGLDHSLTTGVVSALDRELSNLVQDPLHPFYGRKIRGVIQTDAAINPGNSGGPLLDSAGRLIGMNMASLSTSGSSAGLGFALPVDTLNRVVPRLIAKGQLQTPELGFSTMNTAIAGAPGRQGRPAGHSRCLRAVPPKRRGCGRSAWALAESWPSSATSCSASRGKSSRTSSSSSIWWNWRSPTPRWNSRCSGRASG